ncbi:MAG TPA: 1-acyl-sn-glycerol-3-phosphate acyltransferase [Candidatus Egerieimonas intestinavium]|uniref:1-acyl-sn-glycerol-3-phosphate acyltransferase n=1 Tax=Candidatus Egerieimonas intestinavium TaxID=2840777 RepID=A0A9D1EJA7_9FIRM|nr:1-acyl-sn-glycerol-3-phosphate acyltransferase [Candidatus Egerieimonas intestinavium]
MKRILLMVLRNILFVPYGWFKLCYYASHVEKYTEEQRYALLKYIDRHANWGGRITIDAHGVENIPEKNGFIFYPNHQGLYDVLAILEVCPRPFSVVMKKEVANIPFLKQVFACMKAIALDRDDVRQAMKVILQVSEEVKNGRNYLIFAEGTRSRKGNQLLDFKGGSFKSAIKAQCPIVPVAIIDSYKSFDTNSIKKLTVQVHFLKPLLYEDYKDMKSTEIAKWVKSRIEETIAEYENKE